MDVKTTFLNGKLDEEIYMDQPIHFEVEGQELKVFGAKRLNWLRLWPTDSTGLNRRPVSLVRSRSGRGRHKNLLSLLVAFSSRSSLTLVRSRSCRGPVEATITCHALNAPTASDPVDLCSSGRGYFMLFLSPSLETYKLRAPLHL
ncbi:hypothetical protein CK203_108262 [Vitis vinifera]|uniref:Reverse transcriptase Ty1/copia-type domain-containing protein n=1 Tax=Vitis vinifera TaxID=29760 RepID=A0A438CZZ3_VITVI|nr:hypothetical protein CK203_108262 [Vitis vinifera]